MEVPSGDSEGSKGKQMREDMSKFYNGSDFLIVSLIDKPIFSVTVPAKTQTYIAAKKPILAVINGDVSDIVNEHTLGITADPSNIHSINEALKKCIDMPDFERSKLTINNDRLLKTIFNKSYIIDSLSAQFFNCGD